MGLGNCSKDFTLNNMKKKKKKKKELNRYTYKFSVDYNITDANNVINIHKYLIKKHDIMFNDNDNV